MQCVTETISDHLKARSSLGGSEPQVLYYKVCWRERERERERGGGGPGCVGI